MFRIGQSSDIHPLAEGRKLILGGVEIEHTKGLLGHSDADALTHAVAESILGALALGDLGSHFPDSDPRYKGVCSLDLLSCVYEKMRAEGYRNRQCGRAGDDRASEDGAAHRTDARQSGTLPALWHRSDLRQGDPGRRAGFCRTGRRRAGTERRFIGQGGRMICGY